MTEERKELIQQFEKWLATNPNPRITAVQCANIAEDYAEKKINEIEKNHNLAKGGEVEELAENLMRQDDLWEVEGVLNETYDKYRKLAEHILKNRNE